MRTELELILLALEIDTTKNLNWVINLAKLGNFIIKKMNGSILQTDLHNI